MNSTITKTLIAIIVGLIILLSLYGVYHYFFSGTTTQTTSSSSGSAFPESANINPESSGGTGINQTSGTAGQTGQGSGVVSPIANSGSIEASNIKILSSTPSLGGLLLFKPDLNNLGTSTVKKLYARYIERGSGHIYDLGYNENLPQKISNTTITKIYQTFFNNLGSSIVIRGLNDSGTIQNIFALLELPTSTTSPEATPGQQIGKLNLSLLSPSIQEAVVSPDRSKIFYLTQVGDSYIGTTEDFGAKPAINKKQIFSSAFGEWQIQWPEKNTIFFNTKPSANVPGFLYSLNLSKTGTLTKILGDINGLTSSISPDAKKMIYSASSDTGLQTFFYDITARQGSLFPLVTLPEKCVWAGIEQDILYCAVPASLPAGSYPDDWYQGTISFNDEIWKIDTKTGNTELLVDKTSLGKLGGLDATDLMLSPNEDYLMMNNKKDLSVWQIKLK